MASLKKNGKIFTNCQNSQKKRKFLNEKRRGILEMGVFLLELGVTIKTLMERKPTEDFLAEG